MRTRNVPSRIRTIGRLARALRRRLKQRAPKITSLNLGGDRRLIAHVNRPLVVSDTRRYGDIVSATSSIAWTALALADEINAERVRRSAIALGCANA